MFKGDMIVPHQNLGRCHFLKKLTIGLLRTLEGESYRGPSFILVSNHDQHSVSFLHIFIFIYPILHILAFMTVSEHPIVNDQG